MAKWGFITNISCWFIYFLNIIWYNYFQDIGKVVVKLLRRFFNSLSMAKKIFLFIICASVLTQIIVGVLAFFSIFNLSNLFKKEAENLGKVAYVNSAETLKSQSSEYLQKIAVSYSSRSNMILSEAKDQLQGFYDIISEIYENKPPEYTYVPLPEETTEGSISDRNSASIKGYIIDENNYDTDDFLVYDTLENSQKNVYKANLESWKNLSDKQKNEIYVSNCVVSENRPPENLLKEFNSLSNAVYSMKSLYNGNKNIANIYVGTETGILCKFCASNSSSRYDPRTRDWYKDAVNSYLDGENAVVWQEPYNAKTDNALCITCSKAVLDNNNRLLGVVAIDMHIDDIKKDIIDSNTTENAYAFVLSDKGKIIIYPESAEHIIKKFGQSPIDSESSSESYKNVISYMENGKSGISEIYIDSVKYLAAYSPLGATSWSLGIIVNSDVITSPSEELHGLIMQSTENSEKSIYSNILSVIFRFLIFSLFISAFIYFICKKFASEAMKPIKELKNQAKKVGTGDFSYRIINTTNDELGELSEQFNDMARNLQKYISDFKTATEEKQKIHSELSIAKKIQRSMLPCIFPAFPNREDVDIYALMDPAREVGGDFYDFFFLDEERLAVVIADVSDKGISAALFMVMAKILIKNQLQNDKTPAEALEIVNNSLCENNEAGMFVTAFVGVIDLKTGEFIFSNAGHNPPLIYRSMEDKFEFLKSKHGFILGGIQDTKYVENKDSLYKNDILLLYTDGVTESVNLKEELFSEKRLGKFLNEKVDKSKDVKYILTSLREEIQDFSDGVERSDDITILGVKNLTDLE